MITLSNVTYCFAAQKLAALSEVSLILKRGQSWAIVGPDGAGKTTLLRLIVGVLKPSSGNVIVLGWDTNSYIPNEFFHQMGYLPQKLGLYDDLSISQHIDLYANLRNCDLNAIQPWVTKLLKMTLLESFPQRLASNLSGGMRQKLALICALVHSPKLLILDEPTVGVDIKARYEIWSILKELQQEGITLIWASADCEEAQQCQQVIFLDKGKFVLQATPQECLMRVSNRVYQHNMTFSEEQDWRKTFLTYSQNPSFKTLSVNLQGLRIIEDETHRIEADSHSSIISVPETFEDAFLSIYAKSSSLERFSNTIYSRVLTDSKTNAILQVRDLSKHYGSFVAVQPMSFELKRGEILGLLGPNGCGKSTIFKMLCGLLSPTSGSVSLWGHNVSDRTMHGVHSRIGYMPQKFSLYRPLTVHQNLSFFAGLYGLLQEAPKRIAELIELLEITDYQHDVVESLPLGIIQKVSFACALIHQPDLLFLDEPTSGVDPMTRQDFWKILLAVNQHGVSIVVTTHFLEEAQYCHNILLMNQGEKIAIGSPLALYQIAHAQQPDVHSMGDVFLWYLSHQPMPL